MDSPEKRENLQVMLSLKNAQAKEVDLKLTTAPYPIWRGSIMCNINSAVWPEIRNPLPVVAALFISQAR
jgi:hypothetical protein